MAKRVKVRGKRRSKIDDSQIALAYLLLARELLKDEQPPQKPAVTDDRKVA